MRAALPRGLALALTTLALTTACGPTQRDLVQLRADVKRDRTDLRSAESAAAAGARYQASLGKSGAKGRRMLIGRDALLAAFKAHMPYNFDGRRLSKRVKGSFTLNNIRDFELLSRNRARWKWDFKGRNVSVDVKGIFGATAKHAREAREAFEGGGTVVMEGSVWVDGPKNVLRLNGRCVQATLRRHNSAQNRDLVCENANKRLFARQQALPLPKAIQGRDLEAVTTPHHLVLIDR